jgi:transposase
MISRSRCVRFRSDSELAKKIQKDQRASCRLNIAQLVAAASPQRLLEALLVGDVEAVRRVGILGQLDVVSCGSQPLNVRLASPDRTIVVEGPAEYANWSVDDGETFRAYVEQVLAPTLGPGDIVILDNLGSHKVAGVREAIGARGASLVYLPPYSPDLNPIEQAFGKLKALLRKTAARTVSTLWDALGDLIDRFTPQECANYLANAGYVPLNRNRL